MSARRVIRKLAGAVAGPIGEQVAEVAQGLQVLGKSLEGFVSALNPAVAENFNTAIKELSATVGEALVPTFQIFASAIREVADQIAPAMQALAEPLGELAQIIGQQLVVGARLFSALLTASMPIIKALVDDFGKVIKEVVKGMVLFTAHLLRMVGAVDALNSLVNAFAPEAGGTRAAAAGTTSIKDLQQIGKDLAIASANAQGGGGALKNDDYIPKLYEALLGVKANNETFTTFLKKEFDELITVLKGTLTIQWLKNNLPPADTARGKAVLALLSPLGFVAGVFD